MAKPITLKYAGKCADCGTELEVVTTARWYGRGRVYGNTCHENVTTNLENALTDAEQFEGAFTDGFEEAMSSWTEYNER